MHAPGPFRFRSWSFWLVCVGGHRLLIFRMRCPRPALTLLDGLAEVPDPRGGHGRIHPLGAVLGLVTLALLMGRRSLASIARFVDAKTNVHPSPMRRVGPG